MLVLIDNYDSFTYNLYDYLCQTGATCRVVRNDEMSLQEFIALKPEAIVISPGPGRPKDSGITPEVVAWFHDKLPLLGICLGFQAIGEYFGATLVHGPEPVHGKTSTVLLEKDPIFQDIPAETEVMRYHSLVLENMEGTGLCILAKTDTGLPMAMKHEQFAVYGLQFHPESILTPHGLKMLQNWVSVAGIATGGLTMA